MNRRKFLAGAAVGGGFVALAGGVWARHSYNRNELSRKLVTTARPILTKKAHDELQSVPVKGREEIRRWFFGKALKVEPFAKEICSNSYREKLKACRNADEKTTKLLVSYCGKVVTAAEILNLVQTIAQEIGQELDFNWSECCKTISSAWNVHIREYGQPIELDNFMRRVDEEVKQHLSESLEMARVGAQYPALGETIGNIGESALLVLPMSRIQVEELITPYGAYGKVDVNPLAIPTFVLLALKDVFQYISGLFSDPSVDLQRAISGSVSSLGNKIGSTFESEIKSRLAALHTWQKQALTKTAEDYADSAVSFL